jgi:hypothetical protein
MDEAVRIETDRWSNTSVRLLAGRDDPLETVLKRARETVLRAMDQGWSGPPFDPIALSRVRPGSALNTIQLARAAAFGIRSRMRLPTLCFRIARSRYEIDQHIMR